MVRRGAGLAWLPESLVHEDLERGRLVRANRREHDLQLDILLCRRRDGPVRRHLERLWRAATQLFPTTQADGGTKPMGFSAPSPKK